MCLYSLESPLHVKKLTKAFLYRSIKCKFHIYDVSLFRCFDLHGYIHKEQRPGKDMKMYKSINITLYGEL